MDESKKAIKKPKYYKQIYSFPDFYKALYLGTRTIGSLIRNRKTKEIGKDFIERIMLAVTEVNGCPVCSYGHAKWALEEGMSNKEINLLLSGRAEAVPPEQLVAVLFAQHYADSRGNPSPESWKRVVNVYGLSRAHIILGAIRAITVGNILGIAYSSFSDRLKGDPSGKISIFYELGIMFSSILLFPIAMIQSVIARIMGLPVI